jgi:hypothetical protein
VLPAVELADERVVGAEDAPVSLTHDKSALERPRDAEQRLE